MEFLLQSTTLIVPAKLFLEGKASLRMISWERMDSVMRQWQGRGKATATLPIFLDSAVPGSMNNHGGRVMTTLV